MAGAVRIAGMGVVSCHGRGLAPLVEALREGRSGTVLRQVGPIAGQGEFPVNAIPGELAGAGSAGLVGLLAAVIEDALVDAGRDPRDPLGDCGLLVGCANANYLAEAEWRRVRAANEAAAPPDSHALLCQLAKRYGVQGPVTTLHTACSSSAVALLLARERILRGEAKRMLVLGTEGLSSITLRGFLSLLLLDPEGCRPFDAERRGLQLGEGFAALLLERDDGSSDSNSLVGGANLCDTHHLTSASPDGSGMHAVVQAALEDAGLDASEIVAVKAHGTGSPDNDAAEAAAMKRAFGKDPPPLTALKRSLGHTLGACGALETVALTACLRSGFVPSASGFEHVDDELGLVPLTSATPATQGAFLLDFFGFGGNYAALIVRHA